jgi:hypothetical protein
MSDSSSDRRLRFLAIRAALGIVFAVVLTRFFLPASGVGTTVAIAVLLVFFAYLLEGLRKRGKS